MAGEKWVANNGSDGPAVPGTEQEPYETVQHGVDMLKGLGGGVLHVKVGYYNENVAMRGSAYSNISVIGYAPAPSVEGPGPGDPCDAKPVIDGSTYTMNHRVFDIADCTGVALQNLTIQNGSEIHLGADGAGGGVLAENAQVNLLSCCILHNHAGWGGGFAYVNCNSRKLSTVRDCVVRENDAAKDGGGAYIHDSGDVTVSVTAFTKNKIADGFGGGGMFIRHSSRITVGGGCKFQENVAGTATRPVYACNGGAIYLTECDDAPPTIYIGQTNTFEKNTSIGRGGAIHLLNNNYAEIVGNEFTGNTAGSSGGAIGCVQITGLWSSRDVTAEKAAGRFVSIVNNQLRKNHSNTKDSGGGAIYASATSYIVLAGNTLEENTSQFNGGGVHITFNSFLEASGHNLFGKNTAENNGGGLSSRNSHIMLDDENRFADNEAKGDGGGAYLCTADEGTSSVGLSYQTYLTHAGFKKAMVTIAHLNHFEGNKAGRGAGLLCEATRSVAGMSVALQHGNTFTWNETRDGGSGGGFYLGFLDSLAITEDNLIHHNKAPEAFGWGQGGGGLVVGCVDPVVDGNQFLRNEAGNGPGLKLRHCSGFRIVNNTFTNNREQPGGRVTNVYFNACNMGAQTAATLAAANSPLTVSEIVIYP